MIGRWWSLVAEPSLMRRLMLAQMLLLALLWAVTAAFLIYDSARDEAILKFDTVYDAFLTVADSLADQPAKRKEALGKLDRTMRENAGLDGAAELAPTFYVQGRNGQVMYRSPLLPPGVHNTVLDRIETVQLDGRRWRARTVQAAHSGTRMTMVTPADSANVFLTLNSRGYLLLPLLISIPFLLLPAWLSIRMALRPWRSVSQEVAERGPQDLRPLAFTAKYRELKGMVDAINALMRRVSDSAQRERAFIADAAHELRTPLAAMRVNVEALQVQEGDARQRQLLDGILSSGARATRLVSQLLGLMRSDATAGEEEEALSFDELVQERMAVLSGLAHARGIELELSGDCQLRMKGRKEGLVSLVDNLLENAIKYSPEHGTVHVNLRREDTTVVLRIADQGLGIAPELRERVFDRFFRDPRQTQSGSGLGLAIARAVAVQHGGEISLDAVDSGAGLLVTVRLPLISG